MTRRPSLRRRRAADPLDGAEPTTSAAQPDPAEPAPGTLVAPRTDAPTGPATASAEPSPATDTTAGHPPLDPAAPAGHPSLDPAAPAGLEPRADDAPSFRDRGRLRRRLRLLRRLRELAFRDVGGLVFDLHRFGRENTELVAGKLSALEALDAELRAIEGALGDRREFVILHEPGVAACSRCAALHGSDAHFCPNCALGFDGPQAVAGTGVVVPAPTDASQKDPPGTAIAAAPAATVPAGSTAAAPVPPPNLTAPEADAGRGSVRASEAGATPVSSGLGSLAPADAGSPSGTQPATAEPHPDAPVPSGRHSSAEPSSAAEPKSTAKREPESASAPEPVPSPPSPPAADPAAGDERPPRAP